MSILLKKLVLILTTFNMLNASDHTMCPFTGISIFSPRAQDNNNARRIVNWHCYREIDAQNRFSFCSVVTPSYSHSAKSEQIAQALFGTNILAISGSTVENRAPCAMVADYFGLSPQFNAFIELEPNIRNILADFELHATFGACFPNIYAQCNLPIVTTRWHMKMHEKKLNGSTNAPFAAGYMDVAAVQPPIDTFPAAFTGTVTFGQMQSPLQFGKICGARTKTTLADARFLIGWHAVFSETCRADAQFIVTAPTGTRPQSEFFFEPIVGNGHHWQPGVGFSGDMQLWDCGGDQEWRAFTDVTLTTLIRTNQIRSFDLKKNGFYSRFLLAKEFNGTEYINRLVPVINASTHACTVSVDIEFDFAVMASYKCRNWFTDFGYNGWVRSKEKVHIKGLVPPNLGLKGLQPVANGIITNNDTQSNATIFDNQSTTPDMPSPVLIECLDPRSAASPRLVTHKLFFNFSYFGPYGDCNTQDSLFWGLGGEIEFLGYNPRFTQTPDKATMSQWTIWTKIGYVFW